MQMCTKLKYKINFKEVSARMSEVKTERIFTTTTKYSFMHVPVSHYISTRTELYTAPVKKIYIYKMSYQSGSFSNSLAYSVLMIILCSMLTSVFGKIIKKC